MTYSAKVLADSISPDKHRITTLEVTFPRWMLAEFNTHCALTRNSASSRAIPPEKLIERVREHPFIPEFNQRVKGMGVGDSLTSDKQWIARGIWLDARNDAVHHAQNLIEIGVDKSRINRLLEPFMWHTVIVTATEWDNFFALREPPTSLCPDPSFGAAPEFQITARLMHVVMNQSDPILRPHGFGEESYHLPLVVDEERASYEPVDLCRLSASRCARVSYDRHHDDEPIDTTLQRASGLITNFHLSPLGHPARAHHPDLHLDTGPLRGWRPFRKEIPNEHNAALNTGR